MPRLRSRLDVAAVSETDRWAIAWAAFWKAVDAAAPEAVAAEAAFFAGLPDHVLDSMETGSPSVAFDALQAEADAAHARWLAELGVEDDAGLASWRRWWGLLGERVPASGLDGPPDLATWPWTVPAPPEDNPTDQESQRTFYRARLAECEGPASGAAYAAADALRQIAVLGALAEW